MRSKQSFREGLSKQEGAEQKPPREILTSLWTAYILHLGEHFAYTPLSNFAHPQVDRIALP